MNTLTSFDKTQIYSCLPISRSRLYDPIFRESLNQLQQSTRIQNNSPRAQTEKNIAILERDMLQRPRLCITSNKSK
jgi:hypothetical protein